MDSVKYLLTFLFKLAVVLLFIGVVWWGVVTFYPELRLRSMLKMSTAQNATSSVLFGDWLPSPRAFSSRFPKPKTPGSDNMVVYGQTFNGYGNNQGGEEFNYITYRQEGIKMAEGKGTLPTATQNQPQGGVVTGDMIVGQFSPKNVYVRNLSIFEAGHVYSGLSFTGEARSGMFVNGKFPVVVVEQATGRLVTVSYAEALPNPAAPGWIKFQAKLATISLSKVPCFLVFEQGRLQNMQVAPVRVALPESCN